MQSRSTVLGADDLLVHEEVCSVYIIIVTIIIYLSYFVTIIGVIGNGVENLRDSVKKLMQ